MDSTDRGNPPRKTLAGCHLLLTNPPKKELKNEERSCGESFLSLHFGHEDKVLQN